MAVSSATRRALQGLLRLFGVVAIFFGGLTVVLGSDSLLPPNSASVNVDSELRFFAAWYVVAGTLALRAATRVEKERFTVRLIAGGLFLAGVARVISLIDVGAPHPTQIGLMIVELVLPVGLVFLQAAVSRPS